MPIIEFSLGTSVWGQAVTRLPTGGKDPGPVAGGGEEEEEEEEEKDASGGRGE